MQLRSLRTCCSQTDRIFLLSWLPWGLTQGFRKILTKKASWLKECVFLWSKQVAVSTVSLRIFGEDRTAMWNLGREDGEWCSRLQCLLLSLSPRVPDDPAVCPCRTVGRQVPGTLSRHVSPNPCGPEQFLNSLGSRLVLVRLVLHNSSRYEKRHYVLIKFLRFFSLFFRDRQELQSLIGFAPFKVEG